MSILSAIQRAAPALGIDKPSSVFDQDDATSLDLQEITREAARRILEAHDWSELTTRYNIGPGQVVTTDGVTEAFSLPSDFDRFAKGSQVWTDRLQYPLQRVGSADAWLEIDIRDYDYVSGVWIPIGGGIEIKPPPEATETVSFYYQSSLAFSADGQNFFAPATDRNFRLADHLLTLGIIWEWKQRRGQFYAEDMANYQAALEHEIMADKGSNILSIGPARGFRGVKRAYPVRLT